MTAPTAAHRPVLHLVNPPAGPTDAWIQAVARLLLSAADRQLAERAAAADGGADQQHQGGSER